MASDDYLSDTQRLQIAQETEDQLRLATPNHFPRTQNLEYAILKTHLIIEYAITQFIRCTSFALVDAEKIRFTFAQKLDIAVLHGLGCGCSTTVPSIEMLNQIRNQVAHRFTFDRQLVTELIAINSDNGNGSRQTPSDRECIGFLKRYCAFMCGEIAGQIKMSVVATQRA